MEINNNTGKDFYQFVLINQADPVETLSHALLWIVFL